MLNLLPNKISRTFFRFSTFSSLIAGFVFVFTLAITTHVGAVSSDTSSFTSKIVYKVDGTNITSMTPPPCIVSGNSNDTCDFRIRYYSGNTGGTLRGAEIFADVEIGQFDGIVNLVFGEGSFTSGTCTAGQCTDVNIIFLYNNDVHILVDFDAQDTDPGTGDFSAAETFSTTGLATPASTDDGFAVRASPYSIWSKYAANFVGTGSLTDAVDLGTGEVNGSLDFTNGGTNNTSGYTAGSVIFSNGTQLTQDNSNLYFNDTTDKLGIGTNTPLSRLQVNGGIYTKSMPAISINDVQCNGGSGTLKGGTYSYQIVYLDGNGLRSDLSTEISDRYNFSNDVACEVSWNNIPNVTQYKVYRRSYQQDTGTFSTASSIVVSGTPLVDDGSLTWIPETPVSQGDGLVSTGNIIVNSTIPVGMKSLGGEDTDVAYQVAQNSNGNYAVVGTTESYGVGAQDIIAAEYDKQGNVLWVKTFGGVYNDVGYDIIAGESGSYIIVGSTVSFGLNPGNDADSVVMSVNNGNLEWVRSVGGTAEDISRSVVQTHDGGYFITGSSQSYGAGSSDVFSFKMSSDGNVLWTSHVGGVPDDIGLAAYSLSDDSLIFAGYTAGFGSGGNDFYLGKLSSSGALEWTKTYGGTSNESISSILQTGDGGFLLVGTTLSFGVSGSDIYVVKTDMSGDIEWTKTYGGASFEGGDSVTVSSEGGYLIAGSTNTYGAGDSDVYLVKIKDDGTFEWARTIGDTGNDQGRAVVQSSDTGYVVAGFNTDVFSTYGIDVLFAKVDKDGKCGGCPLLNENPGTPTTLSNQGLISSGGSSATGGIFSPASAASAALDTGTSLSVGLYKYKVTFYTVSGETLAGNSTTFINTTIGNTNVDLSNIPLGATGTTGRRVYRTLVDSDTYYQVADIADNSTTTYTDSSSDSALVSTGAALQGISNGERAPNLTLAAGSNLGVGVYKYIVTVAGSGSHADNEVIVGGVAKITTTLGNTDIDLTNIPVGAGVQTLMRNIYRTTVNGNVYYQVDVINDNVTTTYNDTTTDAALVFEAELVLPLAGNQNILSTGTSSGATFIAGGNGILTVTGQINASGNVYADTFYGKEVKLSNFDLAEEYKVTDKTISSGDVVMIDSATGSLADSNTNIGKTSSKYEGTVMGVVSTKPGITLTDWSVPKEDREYMRAIALVGRVPVKVSTENGPIQKGDFLVSASKPGYAMKACGEKYCESGMVVGMALESFTGYVKGDTDLVKQTLVESKNEVEIQISQIEKASSTDGSTDLKIQNENGEEVAVNQIADLVDAVKTQTDVLTEELQSDTLGEGRVMMYVTRTYYIPPSLSKSSLVLADGSANANSVVNPEVLGVESMTEQSSMSLDGSDSQSNSFAALSGGSLTIGSGNFIADASGNLSALGDIVVGGMIKGRDGNLNLQLGDGGKFAVKDSSGKDIFSVNDKGVFGGSAVRRSGWLKVPAGSSIEYAHDLGVNDVIVNLVRSVDLNTGIYTHKGSGTDYYWEVVDYNRIRISNDTAQDINVKVVVMGLEDGK